MENKEKLKHVKPTIEHKEQAIKFIKEFYEFNSNINGVGGLDRYLDNYENWLNKLEDDRNTILNSERVPAETYFLVRENDNKIIGMVNIRLALNEKLKKLGGNIGYCIRPTERRKGYNKINLYLALKTCKRYGIKNVIMDCDKKNQGSEKTIQALGGVFVKEFIDERERIIHRYEIDVESSIENNKSKYE